MILDTEKEAFQQGLLTIVRAAVDINYNLSRRITFVDNFHTWAFIYLRNIVEEVGLNLSKEDLLEVSQQFLLYFLEADRQYKTKIPHVSYRSYITRRIVWGMRDWLIKQSRIVTVYPYYYFTKERPDLLLDLNFLLYGTQIFPFSILSPYERYLIFLHFREEKSILEISYMVQSKWETVKGHLSSTIDKLRRLSNENKNTG